jgi:hypothetical protein
MAELNSGQFRPILFTSATSNPCPKIPGMQVSGLHTGGSVPDPDVSICSNVLLQICTYSITSSQGRSDHDHVGPQINQLFCERSDFIGITRTPANFGLEIVAFGPPKICERTPEPRQIRDCVLGSANDISTPMRRTPSGC